MSASFADLRPKILAEFTGTAAVLCAVIGSGIMAEQLAEGNMAVALLANTLATVFALFVLIETLGPVSGAHFNPLVTLVLVSKGLVVQTGRVQAASFYIAAQLLGAVVGAWAAHAMFGMPIWQISHKLRGGWTAAGQFTGFGQWTAEAIATGGLVFLILRTLDTRVKARPSALVACYIGAAYWFTASTSFANPAAVLGRMLSDSFAGIAPASALGFVLAQCVGALAGMGLAHVFTPKHTETLIL